MKTLVIAEKPSVAQDIARVLGRMKREGDHFENEQYVIAAAAGHLAGLQMPEDIDKKRYGFWRLSELPIMPEKFEVKVLDEKRAKERFDGLKKLLNRKDVDKVLNACDAGREGELIFTYIYELAKCKKPVERLWMQSMTAQAIRDAFNRPRTQEQMKGLQDAARSRSEADWLIGINGTRAITKRMFGRGKQVATVGRVQTPTLSIVLQRELEIRNFVPRSYWRLLGEFHVTKGDYEGTFQHPQAGKRKVEEDKADRIWDEAEAKAILAEVEKPGFGTVEDVKKRTTQSSGRLYDLTSLQREANGRYGLPANRTLQIAQSLYEKHKVLTYPRTDSRALPEDYIPTVIETLGNLSGEYKEKAAPVIWNKWVRPNKRIFNNAQVSDHFAIIPTGQTSSKLTADEQKIYDMVTRRFIAIFYPPAEFDETTRTTTVAGHAFKTVGKVLVEPGYLAVYGKAQIDKELPALCDEDRSPKWFKGQNPANNHLALPLDLSLSAEETKPPARYTEATLLSAMEGAGKLLDDEDLAEAMKEKGLGTPATRAATIEHLLREKYMERDGKSLLPTTKAESLFEFLGAIKVDDLTSPSLTGEWEHKLLLMEKGRLDREAFMKDIRKLTQEFVEKTRNFEESMEEATETGIISPSDGKPLVEMLRAYKSQDEVFTIYKTIGNRKLSEEEVQTLLNERMIGPLDGFRSKAGKPYSAILRLDAMNKVSFDFGDKEGDDAGEDGSTLDRSQLKVVGTFPPTGAKVYETPNAYACENSLDGEKDKAKAFRMSRTMLEKVLPPEEITKLLETGKTGLIKGFRSKRTNRLFDAYLLLKPDGGIGFDFPPRPAKKTAAKKAARKG